ELDIVIPEANIAIEYCGLYWHSEIHKEPKYHLDKLNACIEQNIRLITIFSDEWQERQDIVKSKILQILGKSTQSTIFARKCKVVTLSREQKKKFFDQYHIQGAGPGSITYGLEYKEEVVAAMTFIQQGTSFV